MYTGRLWEIVKSNLEAKINGLRPYLKSRAYRMAQPAEFETRILQDVSA
jgi:hypothetical protein